MKYVYTGYKTHTHTHTKLLCFSVRERGIYILPIKQKRKTGWLLYSRVNLFAEFAHAASIDVHPVCAFSWLLSHQVTEAKCPLWTTLPQERGARADTSFSDPVTDLCTPVILYYGIHQCFSIAPDSSLLSTQLIGLLYCIDEFDKTVFDIVPPPPLCLCVCVCARACVWTETFLI